VLLNPRNCSRTSASTYDRLQLHFVLNTNGRSEAVNCLLSDSSSDVCAVTRPYCGNRRASRHATCPVVDTMAAGVTYTGRLPSLASEKRCRLGKLISTPPCWR